MTWHLYGDVIAAAGTQPTASFGYSCEYSNFVKAGSTNSKIVLFTALSQENV